MVLGRKQSMYSKKARFVQNADRAFDLFFFSMRGVEPLQFYPQQHSHFLDPNFLNRDLGGINGTFRKLTTKEGVLRQQVASSTSIGYHNKSHLSN